MWRGQRIAEPAGYTRWNRPCCAPSQEFCMISLPTGVWGGSDSRHNFAEWPNARAGTDGAAVRIMPCGLLSAFWWALAQPTSDKAKRTRRTFRIARHRGLRERFPQPPRRLSSCRLLLKEDDDVANREIIELLDGASGFRNSHDFEPIVATCGAQQVRWQYHMLRERLCDIGLRAADKIRASVRLFAVHLGTLVLMIEPRIAGSLKLNW
jgi:hypothetical protein